MSAPEPDRTAAHVRKRWREFAAETMPGTMERIVARAATLAQGLRWSLDREDALVAERDRLREALRGIRDAYGASRPPGYEGSVISAAAQADARAALEAVAPPPPPPPQELGSGETVAQAAVDTTDAPATCPPRFRTDSPPLGDATASEVEDGVASDQQTTREPLLAKMDRWRHKIPFWWWLTYDALVGLVIVVGISPHDPAFWMGFAVLGIAVVIDVVEFLVKRPSARAKLAAGAADAALVQKEQDGH